MSEAWRVVAIPGDGIGPEVVAAAQAVVDAVGADAGFRVDGRFQPQIAGGGSLDGVGAFDGHQAAVPATVDALVRIGAEGIEDAMNSRGGKRDQVRVAIHEADDVDTIRFPNGSPPVISQRGSWSRLWTVTCTLSACSALRFSA